MTLQDKVSSERKRQGLTQEELAELTNVTVRTIQRIESGETMPRTFTLKALSAALQIPFENLLEEQKMEKLPEQSFVKEQYDVETTKHFLQIFCLSCFSYIIIPYVHFLIPSYLLKKVKDPSVKLRQFSQKIIRMQIAWVVAFHGLLLITLTYNILQASNGNKKYLINYWWVVLLMYVVNAIIICNSLIKAQKLPANH